MTPKEKAIKLVEKFLDVEEELRYDIMRLSDTMAIQCALITVDEILNANPTRVFYRESEWVGEGSVEHSISAEPYWKEVKQEIQKL